MRISDWSSDVCSSDLRAVGIRVDESDHSTWFVQGDTSRPFLGGPKHGGNLQSRLAFLKTVGAPDIAPTDRKSVVSGKSVSERVDLGGRRIIKQKTKQQEREHRRITD